MPTCRDIATGALRKIGVLGAGREPRQVDLDTALVALRGLYRRYVTSGALGRLRDVIPTTDYVAGENERVLRMHDGCDEVTLPMRVPVAARFGDPFDYGSRWVPPQGTRIEQTRPPRDGAVVQLNDAFTGTETLWIYDGQSNKWQYVTVIALDDQAPLADRDPEGLKAALAMEIADEFGGGLGEVTARRAREFESALAYRWSHDRGPAPEWC